MLNPQVCIQQPIVEQLSASLTQVVKDILQNFKFALQLSGRPDAVRTDCRSPFWLEKHIVDIPFLSCGHVIGGAIHPRSAVHDTLRQFESHASIALRMRASDFDCAWDVSRPGLGGTREVSEAMFPAMFSTSFYIPGFDSAENASEAIVPATVRSQMLVSFVRTVSFSGFNGASGLRGARVCAKPRPRDCQRQRASSCVLPPDRTSGLELLTPPRQLGPRASTALK